MNPLLKEIFKSGQLELILEKAQSMVAETRRKFNTNDIVICAMIRPDKTVLYGKTRERVIELVSDVLPDATETLARFKSEQVSPDRFLLLINRDQLLWVIDWPVASGTEGVIN